MRRVFIAGLSLIGALAGLSAEQQARLRGSEVLEPHRPTPPQPRPVTFAAPTRSRFGEGRSTLKRTMRPRPRPVYSADHDPRSGYVGPKLRRKAGEGKL